jgi:hypothetical protein
MDLLWLLQILYVDPKGWMKALSRATDINHIPDRYPPADVIGQADWAWYFCKSAPLRIPLPRECQPNPDDQSSSKSLSRYAQSFPSTFLEPLSTINGFMHPIL